MLTLTRTPLSLVTNTHYAMSASDDRRTTRRTSARLNEKENAFPGADGVDEDAANTKSIATRGKGKVAATGKTSKRKQDYDEDDDGFMFTRTKTKRAKTAQVPAAVVEEQEAEVVQAQPVKKRGRPRTVDDDILVEREQNQAQREDAAPSRKIARSGTTDRRESEFAPIEIKKKQRSRAKTPEAEQPTAHAEDDAQPRGRSRHTPVATQGVSTKIALPFADTPIIRRNQEMRRGTQGSRRSSLGNRGRRASSLIDGGRSTALPHEHVESDEFFKHIESGLPEPRRMKQLLTWCATRALGDKKKRGVDAGGKDANVRMAAREIQQQILKDFGVRSEMSDWFGREDSEVAKTKGPMVKKPNPRNLANEAKIKELEQQLQRLQSERATWERLLRPSNKGPLLPVVSAKLCDPTTLDASLLPVSNASILERFRSLQLVQASQLQQETRTKLESATKDLEFQTDQLADNVHILGQYRNAADKLATKVLDDAATALEVRSRKDRDRSGTEEVGVRDVLRGLSRVEQRQ